MEQQTQPVLDEQTFQKLLEAAFVLQEHSRRMKQVEASLEWRSEKLREEEAVEQNLLKQTKPEPKGAGRRNVDYTVTLAEIVEAQHQIQTRHLGLDGAMAVVAETIARITHASGAGIGILEDAFVRYRAGAGSTALPVGTEVPVKTAVCYANIRTGQVIRCKDMDTEFLFDPEPVSRRGIRSLVAVPIHYDGNIVGALELYFDEVEGYAEQDIHTCQLMAGLVTEAMGQQAGATLKESMAAERSSMLAAIEKLQPKLSAMATPASGTGLVDRTPTQHTSTGTVGCWSCGGDLAVQEQFCGKCGAPRERGTGKLGKDTPAGPAFELPLSTMLGSGIDAPLPFTEKEAADLANSLAAVPVVDDENAIAPSDSQAPSPDALVWTSAARAQNFFESVSAAHTPGALLRFWHSRRGDFYLALAILLVVGVIGWGVWSNPSVSAKSAINISPRNANHSKLTNADANLSTFDKLLIHLGVAEAPDPPDYKEKGNPDTQVWVDLNTAEYYCPGSDLYEKTAKGKLTSQRDAQLDQFEPAYRKACN